MADLHTKFISAQGFTLSCVGGIVGPIFITTGLDPDYRRNLVFGIFLSFLPIFSIVGYLGGKRHKTNREYVTGFVLPSISLIIGSVIAISSIL